MPATCAQLAGHQLVRTLLSSMSENPAQAGRWHLGLGSRALECGHGGSRSPARCSKGGDNLPAAKVEGLPPARSATVQTFFHGALANALDRCPLSR